MEITIRPYEEGDWKTVVDFGNDEENYLAGLDPLKQRRPYDAGDETYTKWLFEEVRKNDGVVFLAFDGDRAVGHVVGCWNPQTEEDLLFSIPTEKRVWIHDVYVVPEYRSKGVGKKLLNHIEEHFKSLGCEEISLEALAYNERSLGFYDREGYTRQIVGFAKRF